MNGYKGVEQSVVVPEARMFCHPSRVANIYRPTIEIVLQSEESIVQENWSVNIEDRKTKSYITRTGAGRKAMVRYLSERIMTGKEITLADRYFYDARFADNTNAAHLIQHHLTSLGLIKSATGLSKTELFVILDARPASIALDIFSQAGYHVIQTNLPVEGMEVRVEYNEFFLYIPYVRFLGIDCYQLETPQKIFISRKVSRRLINESEIWSCLKEQGYVRYYFEDIPLSLQWSLVRNALEIVSIHGAALGSLAFRVDSNFLLVELFGPGFVADCFRKYVAVLGGRWAGCRGKLTGTIVDHIDSRKDIKKFAFDDFEISTEVVLTAIRHLRNR